VAQRVEKFALVAAAGTSSPTFQNHTFLDGVVTRLELYVPAGHAGLTSWSFWYGTGQVLPKTTGSSVVADDEQLGWDVESLPTGAAGPGGSGYRSLYTNTDTFPHTFHVEVWLDEITAEDALPELSLLIMPLAVS
jgi:hypothetical protein